MPEQAAFNFAGPTVAAKRVDHLERVGDRIGSHVIAFLKRVGKGGEFHLDELTAYVREHSQASPESAGRIMRDLRKRGVLSYELKSRAESLYRMNWIAISEAHL